MRPERKADCHPYRRHKAYGLCENCYARSRSDAAKARSYYPELITFVESEPDITWTELLMKFPGKTKEQIVGVLRDHGQLKWRDRINFNSGTAKPQPYGAELERVILEVPGVDWTYLETRFERTRTQLKSTLYLRKRADLVWLVGTATEGVQNGPQS